ncbi:SCP-like protein [Aphelenchoides besseyi]|nr:SCP-like protein [Aphelenchoides besseyi]
MLWTYFFGVLFVSVSFAQLSDDQRKLVLQLHNQIRSDVARGLALNKNDSALPTGSNIFRLTYSRLVEKLAVAKAKTCEFKHTYVNNTCNNLYLYAANDVFQSIEEALKSSTDAWYNELHTKGLPSLFTGQRNLNHFTELVWHDVLEIGCAIQNCTTMKGIKKTNENHFTFVVLGTSLTTTFTKKVLHVAIAVNTKSPSVTNPLDCVSSKISRIYTIDCIQSF